MLSIEERYILNDIPSGSGMVIDNGDAYIISDDAPYLFRLLLSTRRYVSIPVQGMDTALQRMPKPVKPDYEALCKINIDGQPFLAAFGSGSISPLRDSLLLIDLTNPSNQKKIPLTSLYNKLKGSDTVINIEGAACNDKGLFLLNRENNTIYSIPVSSFARFIQSSGEYIPEDFSVHSVQFPASPKARLSGCSFLDDASLLITASMEDTPDAIQEGKIQGSYIGITRLDQWQVSLYPLAASNGIMLADKLESIDTQGKNSDGSYRIWAIADNDEGNTVLFKMRLFIR